MRENKPIVGNAVIAQSGGPTVVINQSLVGCISGLSQCSEIEKVYGARHGVRGMLEEDFVEMDQLSTDRLERLALTPSAALGSSRDKPDKEYCRRIFKVLERFNVRYFFYVGGNDSSDTCRIVSEVAHQSGYELRAFHIPKTIDNDLVLNDHTPGFPSAARFVAMAFMGDNLDNKALPGIKINVVMGRHAGFLTAASMLGRIRDDDGPHLVYVPEAVFDLDAFFADVDRIYSKLGRCLIAVSEGVHDEEGTPMATKLASKVEKDAHGNVQLSGSGALGDYLAAEVKKRLGKKLRVRADTFGYLQRSFPGNASRVDQQEARMVGRKAAEMAIAGHTGGSIAIKRICDEPYKVDYDLLKLTDVAAKTKVLAAEYIVDSHDIGPSFVRYAAPLVGELPVVEQL